MKIKNTAGRITHRCASLLKDFFRLPEPQNGIGAVISSVCAALALGILAWILLYLTFLSITGTVDMNTENAMLENVEFFSDKILKNILLLHLFFALTVCWVLLTDRIPQAVTLSVALTAVTAFGIWFVLSSQSAPTHDSYIVTNAAYHASMGDGSALDSVYFQRFPFQLGYVLWSEGLIRLLGTENNYLSIEIVNVLCLSVAYFALLRSVSLLWKNRRLTNICTGLTLVTLPPILFCSFTYGTLPSLAFASVAMWQVLCMKGARRDYLHVAVAALSIGISVALKKNCMIIFVALLILLLFRFIRQRSLQTATCFLLCILSVWLLPLGAQKQYEKRFDLSFGDGIPMTSWLAMGLNESYIANGWYDATYTVINFNESGMDSDVAAERSAAVIRERVSELRENPRYAREFFSEKIESQWNEPTFQSIWTNQVRGRYGEMGALASRICDENEAQVKAFMDAVLQFLYLFSAIGAIALLRRRRIEDALFGICVIGGFLYHALFEAKSQYIIPYLILLLPIAAYGLYGAVDLIDKKLSRRMKDLLNRRRKEASNGN